MTLHSSEVVVKTGTFLYDETIKCDIRIVRSPIRYGTGDHDDPPEEANDQDREVFYVQFGSTTERGKFNSGCSGKASLEDAVLAAETASGIGHTVQWVE
jgi:hypothetical protein